MRNYRVMKRSCKDSQKCRLENRAIECIYESKPHKLPLQDTNSNPNLCMRIKLKSNKHSKTPPFTQKTHVLLSPSLDCISFAYDVPAIREARMDKSEMDTRRVALDEKKRISDVIVLVRFWQSNRVLTIRMLNFQEVGNSFIL